MQTIIKKRKHNNFLYHTSFKFDKKSVLKTVYFLMYRVKAINEQN